MKDEEDTLNTPFFFLQCGSIGVSFLLLFAYLAWSMEVAQAYNDDYESMKLLDPMVFVIIILRHAYLPRASCFV